MPKDKTGTKLTWKQYFKRWKQGIEGITPLQQASVAFKSTFITLTGLLGGIIVALFNLKAFWWLIIVLTGALVNTIILQIANYQKLMLLRRIYNEDEQESTMA